MTVNLQVGNAQVIGARTEQQDAFGFSDKDDKYFVRHGGLLAVVADGMGGHAYGGEASRIAVKAFLQAYMAKPRQAPIIDALCRSFHAANKAVCQFAEAVSEAGNCGTTLIAAVVHPASRSLYWIGTGDSRILLFRGLQWVQVTTDTNYANQQLSNHIQGESLRYDWESDGHLQGLTSFLGLQEIQEIDRSLRGFMLHPGDWLVLCTDGVYNTLTVDEILPILRGEPNDACERIVQEVLIKSLHHQDNAYVFEDPLDSAALVRGIEWVLQADNFERVANAGLKWSKTQNWASKAQAVEAIYLKSRDLKASVVFQSTQA